MSVTFLLDTQNECQKNHIISNFKWVASILSRIINKLLKPISGNEYFKVNDVCSYLSEWIKSGIKYVKHLVNENGTLKNYVQLMQTVDSKRNIHVEICI